jgi:transcription initiation factor TFIID subunit 12
MIAEEFVENVTQFACLLAKHRNSTTLEVKDLQLYLGRLNIIHHETRILKNSRLRVIQKNSHFQKELGT